MKPETLLYPLVFAIGVLWPALVICRRAGINRLWAMTLFIPVFGLVIFSGVLAFKPWSPPAQVSL